jgi:glycerol-3-phosphate dehydrogenase
MMARAAARPGSGEPRLRAEVDEVAALRGTRVVVIGGGINGISTFRDLAHQGVDVVLVERDDVAGATSAASSHMIHGGIRYLEYGEFRLVRESVRERNDLLLTAPHLVRPLPTTIPIYRTFSGLLSAPWRFLAHRSGPAVERGALLIKVGLVVYDFFSRGGRVVPRHRFHGRRRTREALPALDPRAKYSATYYDAGMRHPERLAFDVLLDGLRAHDGARAVTYVEAIGATASGVRLRDRESGHEFDLDADVVVNAAGPWADPLNAALGMPTRFVGGTKGSHIVLDHPELLAATAGREIFFEHDDGRIVLVYPLGDRVLVGTTDLEADVTEPVACTEEEVDYFFGLVRHVFPGIQLDRSAIVYRFAGVRPLPRHDGVDPRAVSRDYRIQLLERDGMPPVLSLVGGKWTTFRALGESLADRALGLLGLPRRRSTRGVAIGGGRDYPADAEARAAWIAAHLGAVDVSRAEVLFERYGTRAAEVAADIAASPVPDAPLAGGLLSTGEVAYLARVERVVHLEDLLFRRTDLAFTGRADRAVVEEAGAALAAATGWDDLRLDREIEQTVALLRTHGAGEEDVFTRP